MNRSSAWIRNVVASLEREAGAETCARVLESCGRRCFPPSLGSKAQAAWNKASTARAFIERLSIVATHVAIADDEVRVTYPQCYCAQIRAIPVGEVPGSYCACSVGWVKELFLRATGRDVAVTVRTTILRGDKECCFVVDLGVSLDEPLR